MNHNIRQYLSLRSQGLEKSVSWENLRFAVLDTESTGLDPKKDRMVSIGAIGVSQGEINLDDTFAVFMPIAYNTSSVMVHGITKEFADQGIPEEEALEQFLLWLQDAVIVGHHVGHDIAILNAAMQRHFGCRLWNPAVDTMELFLVLQNYLPEEERVEPGGHTLDALAKRFQVTLHDRHTAEGDAFITARIFQKLLRKAHRHGCHRLGDICWEGEESTV